MHDHPTDQRTRHPGIVKRGNRYQIRYRDRQGKSHRRSAPTLGAALDLQAKLRTGTASTQAAPLFEAYAAEWKRTYRGRNGKAREATLAGYRWVVDNELVAHFGRMRLDRIGPADVREWLAGLAARGLARGTCGLRLRVLRLVFACAVEDELIHRNPCQHVRAAYTAPDAAQTEQGRALSDDERQGLLDAMLPGDRLLGLLLDGLGLRISEALALEWDDIDLGQRVVHVRRRYYRGHVGPPKSKRSYRSIPVSRDLARALFEARANAVGPLILPSRQTGQHRTYAAVALAFSKAAERAGLPEVTMHDLRHTWGSRLYSNGLDLLTLSRLLGHSDTTITMRVYLHEMPDAPLPDIDALLVKQGTPEGHRRDTAPPDITGYAGAVQPEETAITSGIG